MPISVDNAVGDKYTCLAKKLSNYIYGSKIHMCQNPNCFWELITLQQLVVYIGRRVISQKFPNLPRKCIKLCVVCIWNYAEFLKYRTPSYRSLKHTALFHHKNAIATVAQFINLLPQQSGFFCPRCVYHAKNVGAGRSRRPRLTLKTMHSNGGVRPYTQGSFRAGTHRNAVPSSFFDHRYAVPVLFGI